MKKLILISLIYSVLSCSGGTTNKESEKNNFKKDEIMENIGNTINKESPKNLEPKKPYEGTWMKITQTDNGYVVYYYSNMDDEENESLKRPIKYIVKDNVFQQIHFSTAEIRVDTIRDVILKANGEYLINLGTYTMRNIEYINYVIFKIIDEKRHISCWILNIPSTGEYDKTSPGILEFDCIDSVYNTYPIVDYEWEMPDNYEYP
jgi:hypothetical protein